VLLVYSTVLVERSVEYEHLELGLRSGHFTIMAWFGFIHRDSMIG
jgi:hypothetical protein